MVDFDHGVWRPDYPLAPNEVHYMLEDQNGTLWGLRNETIPHPECAVYDMDIYNNVTGGKIAFAFINTCLSADINLTEWDPELQQYRESWQGNVSEGRARGMPYAWTHRTVGSKEEPGFDIAYNMSNDGYSYPDDGSQCYIGFPWGSASLSQQIPLDSGPYYKWWVIQFFHYALYCDVTVNMALDFASMAFWGANNWFGVSPLQNFAASWSGLGNFTASRMAVYGNGRIHLNAIIPRCRLVVRGENNLIYYRTYTPVGWADWDLLPSGSTCDSPASTVCNGKQYFVVRDADGEGLWMNSLNLANQEFSGWTQLTGDTKSPPSLVNNGTHIFLTVRSIANAVCFRVYDCALDSWGDWVTLQYGVTCDGPATAMIGDNLHMVVRGFSDSEIAYNNTMYHAIVKPDGTMVQNWMQLSGATPSKPALAVNQWADRLCLVVRGMNDHIFWRLYDFEEADWTDWVEVSTGSTCDGPAADVKDEMLHIVVRGMGGSSLWYGYVNLTESTFYGWTFTSGSSPSPPVMVSNQPLFKVTLHCYYEPNIPVDTAVHIDNEYVGRTGSEENAIFVVTPGTHTIRVDESCSTGDGYALFDYYDFGGTRVYYPETQISVCSNIYIEVHYWIPF